MKRRDFLALSAATGVLALAARPALANVPTPFDPTLSPPMDDRQKFIDWMVKNRGEDPKFLGLRFDRFRHMVANKDIIDNRNKKAFLFTPREAFVLKQNLDRAYDSAFLDINYGVTISGPHLVGRMTTAINVQPTDKVLEIGTGSGYQAAVLAELVKNVYSIEIVASLGREAAERLAKLGYRNVEVRIGDGYKGWPEKAPFDGIIVTAAAPFVPAPLVAQLKPGGKMIIPVDAGILHQDLLLIEKHADGTTARRVVLRVRFVPLTGPGVREGASGRK